MEQSDVRYSQFEHVVCGFLLACILFATIFLFMQNSWGAPTSTVSVRPSSSSVSSAATMVWYPTGPTHAAASTSPMIVYPTVVASSQVSVSSSSSTAMTWYPASSSTAAVASLASSSSYSSSQMYVSSSSVPSLGH